MNTIEKKTISFVLTLLTILAGTITVLASVTLYYEMPMNVTIEGQPTMSIYVNDNPWTNGTSVEWGTKSPGGSYQKNLSIHNTCNSALQISLSTSGLPQGWDLTYSQNGTIVQPDNWLNGTITLTTSSQSPDASYYWVAHIHAS